MYRVHAVRKKVRHAEFLGRAVHPSGVVSPDPDAHALLVHRLPADGGTRFRVRVYDDRHSRSPADNDGRCGAVEAPRAVTVFGAHPPHEGALSKLPGGCGKAGNIGLRCTERGILPAHVGADLQLVGRLRRAGGDHMPPHESDALRILYDSARRRHTHRRGERVLRVDVYPLADARGGCVGRDLYLPLDIVRGERIRREVIPGLCTADGDALDVLLSLCAPAQHGRSLDDLAGRILGSLCRDRPAEAVDLVLQHAAAVRRIQVRRRDRQFFVVESGPAACSGSSAGIRHLDLPINIPCGQHARRNRIALCGIVDGIFCVRRSTVFPPAQLCRYLPNGAGQIVRFCVAQAPRKVDGKALVSGGAAGWDKIGEPYGRGLEGNRDIVFGG